MSDVAREIDLVTRHVGDREIAEGNARTVAIARTYDTTPADLWDACTDPERIPRWFLPISGDLRLGGRYQLEGNAGGVIERCDPPRSFAATWEYGGAVSWIAVSVAPRSDGRARFELEHTALVEDGGHWAQFGPGAVGVGWDMGVLGLARPSRVRHGHSIPPEALAWLASDEGREFVSSAVSAGARPRSPPEPTPRRRAPPPSGRPPPTPPADGGRV